MTADEEVSRTENATQAHSMFTARLGAADTPVCLYW